LQTDPTGYSDSMNLYQGFNQNPVNFVDPMGTELSAETIKYWGSYEKASKYVKYVYGLYLAGGDSAGTAYNNLVNRGLVTDTGSPDDIMFSIKLAISPSLDVFDVTPAQFAKDVLGGVINSVTSMVSMAAKGLPGGCNPYLWAQIDKAKNWAQSKVNKAIGANEGSLGYFMGETYAPAIAGGWLSAEIELANVTAQTGKTLPFLGTEPPPLPNPTVKLHGHHTYPKALGGHPDQELAYILDNMHTGPGGIHSDLAKFEGGWLRPTRLMTGKDIVNLYGRDAVIEGLRRFYSQDKWKYLIDKFENAVKFTLEKLGI
jgi:hypothetical protein